MLAVCDLFCGGGGAALGLKQAGFDIIEGYDIRAQPYYPFEMFVEDAMNVDIEPYDFIWASPPCQGYSTHVISDGTWDKTQGKNEKRLINLVREKIKHKPYIIENVTGAREELINPIMLCGITFGLPIARHRLFESNIELIEPKHQTCRGVAKKFALDKGWDYRDMSVTGKGRHAGTSDRWKEIMGIPANMRMIQHQIREAIPPAYSQYLGKQVINAISM